MNERGKKNRNIPLMQLILFLFLFLFPTSFENFGLC